MQGSPSTASESQDSALFQATLEAARGGDQAALALLFEQFYPRVQRIVHARLARDLRTVRPWLAARFSTGDVVQEVFTSVLGDLDAFEGSNEGGFAGYLAMIVRNRIVDMIRFHEAASRDGRKARGVIDEDQSPPASEDQVSSLIQDEEIERYREALTEFSHKDQLLLRARLEGTATFAELAEQLGYGSSSAARRAFHTAQAHLAFLLEGKS